MQQAQHALTSAGSLAVHTQPRHVNVQGGAFPCCSPVRAVPVDDKPPALLPPWGLMQGLFRQGALLAERDFGVLLAVVTLLLGVVARSYEGYEGLVPKLVKLLERLRNKDVTPDYAYYGIPSPWLQARLL